MSSSRTLQITYVGMKSQDVPIKSGTIKVMMKSDSEVLQEVVVTGMQKMDKRLFTGATKQLNADNVKLDGLYNRQIKKFPTEKQNVSLKHILT